MKMWHRFALANGITTVLTLLILGSVITGSTIRALHRQLEQRAEAEAQLVARQVEAVIESLEYAGNTLAVMTNDAVAQTTPAAPISLEDRITLENQLSFTLGVFPAVAHGWLLFPKGSVVSYGRMSAESTVVARRVQALLQPDAPMGPNRLTGSREDQLGDSVLILAKQLINIATGEPIAALLLAADADSFAPALERTAARSSALFSIVDNRGVLVGTQRRNGTSYTVFEAALDGPPWRVVSQVPRQTVQQLSLRVISLAGVLLVLASALASVVALSLARTITRPLESLVEQMRTMDVEQGLSHLAVPGTEEIQRVAEGTNRLLERVHGLVDRVAAEERAKQRYHFALLQSQIKPHFLYNSLETIHMLGETGHTRRGQRALRALSEFYRLSLAGGRDLIPLSLELELTRNYLLVQHLRYRDQFTYETRSEGTGADTVTIPKLTVQPLVENAIYHGIKGVGRRCRLKVEASALPSGSWRVTVTDDGRGMEEDRLRAVRDLEVDSAFGFTSVIKRLRLHLGEEVRFSIDSRPDQGTTVSIDFPGSSMRSTQESDPPARAT